MGPLLAGTSWDSLREELHLLNASLLGQVQQRTQKNTQLDYLQGLVLSEHEVLEILTKPLDSIYAVNTRHDQEQPIRETNDFAPHPGQLAQLRDLFQLERIEELCLLLCLAPEIDARYSKVFAFLQDDVTRKQPGVELALRLFCKDVHESLLNRRLFASGSPLFRHRLINYAQPSDRQLPLLQRLLKIDDRIAAFVLHLPQIDDCLVNWVEIVPPSDEHPEVPLPRELVDRTLQLVESSFSGTEPFLRPLVHLYGRRGSGRRALAALASRRIGVPLIIADIKKLANGEASEVEVLSRLCREALLLPALLLIENFDELLHDGRQRELAALQEAAHYYAPVTFLSGKRIWKPETPRHFYLSLECPVPDATSRVDFWRQHLHKNTEEFQDQDFIELSSKFSFTEGQIHQTVTTAQHRAYWENRSTSGLTPKLINEVARSVATPSLIGLARKIETPYSWADIVLPENQMRQLMEVVSHARRSQIIFETWGFAKKFAYGRGITALFEGQSGTGKTMAASIIGHELQLDVYQIDLSAVVSKYIGETEKNLSRIFEEAQDSNAVLFFDEADALFGKRSEVKDAHDRYANIETAYLLQRMEEYSGIVILATNMRHNVDEAFVRRMRFIVHFPFPSAEDRERIWQKSIPAIAPLGDDVDFRWLARKLNISGGNIKNISLRAAFLAIERQGVIGMDCLVDAAKREIEKIGKILALTEFRGTVPVVQTVEVEEVA
jgi:hypothetical protein